MVDSELRGPALFHPVGVIFEISLQVHNGSRISKHLFALKLDWSPKTLKVSFESLYSWPHHSQGRCSYLPSDTGESATGRKLCVQWVSSGKTSGGMKVVQTLSLLQG